jgi:hypothetical protein
MQLQSPDLASNAFVYEFPAGALSLAAVAVIQNGCFQLSYANNRLPQVQRAFASYSTGVKTSIAGFAALTMDTPNVTIQARTLKIRQVDVPDLLAKPHRCTQLLMKVAEARQNAKAGAAQAANRTAIAVARAAAAGSDDDVPIADGSSPPPVPGPSRPRIKKPVPVPYKRPGTHSFRAAPFLLLTRF